MKIKIMSVMHSDQQNVLSTIVTDENGRIVKTSVSKQRADKLKPFEGQTMTFERFIALCRESLEM